MILMTLKEIHIWSALGTPSWNYEDKSVYTGWCNMVNDIL